MKEEKSQLFAEQYIEGREFTVPFLGTGLLPIAEVTYQGYPDGKPKILAQSAKWSPDSFEYKHTGSRFEFTESDERLLTSLRYNSKQCIKLFHLCGWGRIDYRVDKDNNSYIIDINVGSFLAPDAWWAESVKFAGVEFDAAIQVIIEDSTK
jgi:D-alanine-D-alanine ligase